MSDRLTPARGQLNLSRAKRKSSLGLPTTPHHQRMGPERRGLLTPSTGLRQRRRQSLRRSTVQRSVETSMKTYSAKGIMGVSWRVYRVSPLFNFHLQPHHLSRMARSLQTTFQANLATGTGVAVSMPESDAGSASVPVSVDITLKPDLRGCERDTSGISITVTRLPTAPLTTTAGSTAIDGDRESVLARAVLCSVGYRELVDHPAPREGFTHLPLLLMKASASASSTIIAWLQDTFDCIVRDLSFEDEDLRWIATEWAVPDVDDESEIQRPLTLFYKIPNGNAVSTVTYAVQPESVRLVQKSLRALALEDDGAHKRKGSRVGGSANLSFMGSSSNGAGNDEDGDGDAGDDGDLSADSVAYEQLLPAVEQHLSALMGINVDRLLLAKVGTFSVFAGSDGRIKLLPVPAHRSDEPLLVLKYLTFMATRHLAAAM